MNFLSKLLRHELISGSFYIFIGSIISNILAFVLNLFLARSLTASDYGIYSSLLSVIALFSIPATSLTPVIVRFATDYFNKKEEDKARVLYFNSFKFISFVSFVIFLVFVIFSKTFLGFLQLNNSYYILLTGLIVFVSYVSLVNTAFLQSLLKFGFMSFVASFSALVKLVIGIMLVFLGFRVFSGLLAVFFMSIIPIILGFFPLRFLLKKIDKARVYIPKREVFFYAVPTSVAIFSLTSFISTDVILVKHFFSPEKAGLYSGLSLIGRVIFYFTVPISTVMFPLIIKRHNFGKSFNNLFYLAVLLVILASFSITTVYFFLPNFVVNLFLGGGTYLRITSYIGLFGVFITIFSILNICVNFFLSLKQTQIAWVVLFGALGQAILISLFHKSFYQIIGISIFSVLFVLIILVGYFIKKYVNLSEIRESLISLRSPL